MMDFYCQLFSSIISHSLWQYFDYSTCPSLQVHCYLIPGNSSAEENLLQLNCKKCCSIVVRCRQRINSWSNRLRIIEMIILEVNKYFLHSPQSCRTGDCDLEMWLLWHWHCPPPLHLWRSGSPEPEPVLSRAGPRVCCEAVWCNLRHQADTRPSVVSRRQHRTTVQSRPTVNKLELQGHLSLASCSVWTW